MTSNVAPLRLGSKVRFRDRWEGRLTAFEVDEGWEVANVVVTRGVLQRSSVKLPFSVVSEWSEDHVAFGCSSDEAFGRKMPPVAAPVVAFSTETRLATTGARLSGALVERRERRASHLLVRRGTAPVQELKAPVRDASFEAGRLLLGGQADRLPIYRSDAELLGLMWEALASHPRLTSEERRALRVEVSEGVVRLTGNVRTAQAKRATEEAAASVAGAMGRKNGIVDDISLELEAGRSLEGAGLSRTATVYARSSLGHVSLFGRAPSERAVEEIVRVVSKLPGVRSVRDRMQVLERTA